jgi:hypothetical protein
MKILPLLLVAAALGGTERDVHQPLFVIERNTNGNVVHYDANLKPDGQFDPRCPVQAYWIIAEDGRREELNSIERAKAYGFTVEPDGDPQAYRVELVAQKQRPIEVFRQDGTVRAETTIAGHRAYLTRIYVTAHHKVLAVPAVKSIEWFGTDVATNQAVHETVMP